MRLKILGVILSFSGACGIEDGDSLIITGGGWSNPGGEIIATKTVDRYRYRYNSEVYTLFLFPYYQLLNQIQLFHHYICI